VRSGLGLANPYVLLAAVLEAQAFSVRTEEKCTFIEAIAWVEPRRRARCGQ
jgi:hypothetical protein